MPDTDETKAHPMYQAAHQMAAHQMAAHTLRTLSYIYDTSARDWRDTAQRVDRFRAKMRERGLSFPGE